MEWLTGLRRGTIGGPNHRMSIGTMTSSQALTLAGMFLCTAPRVEN